MANPNNRGDAQTGQAREYADAAKAHLQQAGSEAKQAAAAAASGLAHAAEDKTDEALASVGQRLSSVAGSLRQAAPRQGVVGSAAGAVADQLQTGGRYLQEHGVSDISDDIAGAIRRNPVPALAIAFGLGLVLGFVIRR
ncbi:MAG TPA: hypothetical protein VKA46_02180 [Gemmataceae bacterium]|nr:hypothetical protein [Gemmataceae bacterium]